MKKVIALLILTKPATGKHAKISEAEFIRDYADTRR